MIDRSQFGFKKRHYTDYKWFPIHIQVYIVDILVTLFSSLKKASISLVSRTRYYIGLGLFNWTIIGDKGGGWMLH